MKLPILGCLAVVLLSNPGARLVRVESNRGVAEKRQGRYYLRYQYDHGATEFWGYLSATPKFDFKNGVVGVVVTPDMPPS